MSIKHQPANLTLAQIQQMIGGVMLLSQHSPLHRRYVVAEWQQRIMPAFELNQFCYYEDEHGRPIAFCNWAFVSSRSEMSCYLECAKYLHPTGVLASISTFQRWLLHSGMVVKSLTIFVAVYFYRGRGRKSALSAAKWMLKMTAVSERYSGFLFNS